MLKGNFGIYKYCPRLTIFPNENFGYYLEYFVNLNYGIQFY